jgi:hypothetical protein
MKGASMPKQQYQRQEPTHDWQQIRLRLTDPAQITYEIIRLVILSAREDKGELDYFPKACGRCQIIFIASLQQP